MYKATIVPPAFIHLCSVQQADEPKSGCCGSLPHTISTPAAFPAWLSDGFLDPFEGHITDLIAQETLSLPNNTRSKLHDTCIPVARYRQASACEQPRRQPSTREMWRLGFWKQPMYLPLIGPAFSMEDLGRTTHRISRSRLCNMKPGP